MFPMRIKITARQNEWRCCFCLHVRTATIFLGIWHLILHVLALTVLALLMRNHHIMVQKHNEFSQSDFLPTPLSKVKEENNPYYLPTTQDGRTIYSSDIDMGALMTVFTLSISLLMVYGAIKGKATHLLPFFCLQLFDFAITTLTATGYFCYLRSVHRLVAEHWHNLPFRNELLQLSPQYLSLLVLAAFLFSMMWKAYCIGIVWRCYKYLALKQQTRHHAIHYILPGEGSDRTEPTDYPSLFRDQESASAFGALKQTPPPSYQDIMDDQPPPYPSNLSLSPQDSPDSSVRVGIFPATSDRVDGNAAPVEAPSGDVEGNAAPAAPADSATTRVVVETEVAAVTTHKE
ncbi:unnamed protein product [Brassicogethes aeneus]|uniref:Lysosomal-associated transmembrane protein 4B n=1 Tax=Brassicogethes aeneus TaxID=1431903 RepID=A0A9P0BII9_BRAAE|nr:unnamed protein product [Brassicogethes aeneus]